MESGALLTLAQLAEGWNCKPSDWFPDLPGVSRLQLDAVAIVSLNQFREEQENIKKGILYL